MLCRLGRCLCVALAALAAASAETPPAPAQAPGAKEARGVVVKHVTLQGKMPLSKALQAVRQQTGIEVRRGTDDDPTTREDLKLDKVPFWQALDEIARSADVRLSLYQRDGKPALVAGPYREVPTCYSGPFRITLKRLVAIRDFDTNGHGMLAKLEVAWQPPFQPFLLETRPETFSLKDDRQLDQEFPPLEKSAGYIGSDRLAFDFDVALPALRRDVRRLGVFKGELKMIGSASTLRFYFKTLAKEKQEQEGVSAEILKVADKPVDDETVFTVDLRLKYPPSAVKESHQIADFLVRARAQLVRGNRRLPPGGDFGFDPENGVMTYRWEGPPKELGKPEQWALEYVAPGPVLEVPIQFEFKDVPLP